MLVFSFLSVFLFGSNGSISVGDSGTTVDQYYLLYVVGSFVITSMSFRLVAVWVGMGVKAEATRLPPKVHTVPIVAWIAC